jgi:hypothetical protein
MVAEGLRNQPSALIELYSLALAVFLLAHEKT